MKNLIPVTLTTVIYHRDELNALPYLDAVVHEALRLYDPVPHTRRNNQKQTVLPLSKPVVGRNGEVMDSLVLPADTPVLICKCPLISHVLCFG